MAAPKPNRWGFTFKRGDHVDVTQARGDLWHARYVRLAPPDDYSRAYGRQVLVSIGSDDIGDDLSHVGYDDIAPAVLS